MFLRLIISFVILLNRQGKRQGKNYKQNDNKYYSRV
nr:MAG TPA: hypothetical protein [Caudoviricetes sp.]DAY04424.1 MAG TPA: hypothetical protein [Caudoviricetes sp.]